MRKCFFLTSQALAQERNEKDVKKKHGRSDFHRYPPRQSARRQDLKWQGTDHRPLSIQPRREATTATFAGRSRAKGFLTVGCRGFRSSTRVGSVAPLGNTKEDDYYRNDSMKYCRHEEKKRKRGGKVGCEAGFKYSLWVVRALLRTRSDLQSGWVPAVDLHFGFWSLGMETCAENFSMPISSVRQGNGSIFIESF